MLKEKILGEEGAQEIFNTFMHMTEEEEQQLTIECAQRHNKDKGVSSDSESGHKPTTSEALHIAKGKGVSGASQFRAVRNIHLVNAEARDTRVP
ncbi:unnamed protein product [Cochlearia groenlandica]